MDQCLDTTRSPRIGEENGRSYYFVTREEFQELKERNAFLEWAEFSKNLYGTSVAAVEKVLQDDNKICILDIDLQGVQSVKRLGAHLHPRYVFIKPPSLEDLKSRLLLRNTESPESLDLRLKIAENDSRFAEENPDFYDAIVVNDDVEVAYKKLTSFIFDGIIPK